MPPDSENGGHFAQNLPAGLTRLARKIMTDSSIADTDWTEFWLVRLSLNLLCYSSLAIPVWILMRYLKFSGHLARAESLVNQHIPQPGVGLFHKLIALCFVGKSPVSLSLEEGGAVVVSQQARQTAREQERAHLKEVGLLLFCFFGLQGSYLTWGILQEKIMTQEYKKVGSSSLVTSTAEQDRFKDSLFLVFMNRVSAFTLSGLWLLITVQPTHTAPLTKYSYASFSNIMSSWFQYEALKFVSFPAQVLGKASKVIPVMLMGKCVGKQTYVPHQYGTAALISAGVALFLLSQGMKSGKSVAHATTFSGIILMAGYLLFDSFTSNWQGALYKQYRMKPMQMMCGVNLFSSLLTIVSLLEQGTFLRSLDFMLSHEMFIRDVCLLSVCSAVGQLFIFFTIEQFGPVTFTIIMTIRQALAILLSCIIYGHVINATGVMGILLVFVALLLRTYLARLESLRKKGGPEKVIDKVPLLSVASPTKS